MNVSHILLFANAFQLNQINKKLFKFYSIWESYSVAQHYAFFATLCVVIVSLFFLSFQLLYIFAVIVVFSSVGVVVASIAQCVIIIFVIFVTAWYLAYPF